MEQATSPARLRPRADVFSRRLAAGAVLVDLRGNVVFELNETAAVIWDSIAAGDTPDAIVQQLCRDFDIDADRARTQFDTLIDRLRGEDLLES